MIRLGGAASAPYIEVFRGLQEHFGRQGIDLDWVLYSDYDALVDAFVNKEIDLAWNGPLAYVKIKRRLNDPCKVVAMRDIDVNYTTHFVTLPDSGITTVEDLMGKRFAFGSRGSIEAGVLAYHFLKESGIDPEHDFSSFTFNEDRNPGELSGDSRKFISDEHDVIERVRSGEYDAGAVCQRNLERLEDEGTIPKGSVRIFWSSPGYSHCCFTAQGDMDRELARKITEAFVSVDYGEAVGKAVLDGEGCGAFVPGTTRGWEALEKIAQEEGLV